MSALQPTRQIIESAAFPTCPQGKFVVGKLAKPACKLSIVVPTYQEAGNIQDFLTETCSILDRELPSQYEVIVVDDDSPDGTWLIAAQSHARYPGVRMMRRIGERGLAGAVIRGYQVAMGEILGTINADFQHPPAVLARMIELARNADVVVASRFCNGGGTTDWPQDRLLMSRAAFQAGKLFLPNVFSGLSDPLSGLYLFQRTVIEGIKFSPMGFKTLIEVLARGRARRIAECPYEMHSRRSGSSKATIESSLLFLKQLRLLQIETNAKDAA